MNKELQMQGANARALGLTELDCPLYKADQVPAATGETAEAWASKVEAWQFGWKMEDAIRDG